MITLTIHHSNVKEFIEEYARFWSARPRLWWTSGTQEFLGDAFYSDHYQPVSSLVREAILNNPSHVTGSNVLTLWFYIYPIYYQPIERITRLQL